MSMDDTFSVIISKSGRSTMIRNLKPTTTIKELKRIYFDQEIGYGSINFSFRFKGKSLSNDYYTLKDYDITQLSRLTVAIRVFGGGCCFDECHSEWKVMIGRCPVCMSKNIIGKDKLPKGYWYHPGGNKAEFRSTKPGTYAVETKEENIRCSGCKNEAKGKEWVYKCVNHDFEKMKC
eukprot:UN10784